jgi:hypothetical protein
VDNQRPHKDHLGLSIIRKSGLWTGPRRWLIARLANDHESRVERRNSTSSTILNAPSARSLDRICRPCGTILQRRAVTVSYTHTSEEPMHLPRNSTATWAPQSQPPKLNDLPTEILLQIMDWISPFFRACTLPLVSRRIYLLEKRFWIDCRPPRSGDRSRPKEEFAQRYSCLKPDLQRALRINASIIPLQSILIPSSYVALSHLLLTEALEARQQDTRILEGICRSLANICCSTDLPNNAIRLRNAAKAQARACHTLSIHIVDAVRAVIKAESAQPTANISDLHLTRFMFRNTSDAMRAVYKTLE